MKFYTQQQILNWMNVTLRLFQMKKSCSGQTPISTEVRISCWISLSLRSKTETERLNIGLSTELRYQSPQRVIADVISDSSLISPYFFVFI